MFRITDEDEKLISRVSRDIAKSVSHIMKVLDIPEDNIALFYRGGMTLTSSLFDVKSDWVWCYQNGAFIEDVQGYGNEVGNLIIEFNEMLREIGLPFWETATLSVYRSGRFHFSLRNAKYDIREAGNEQSKI